MAGMAFGTGAHDLFGPSVGPPALYAVVAMGGVFAAAAQAPLTAIASVVEMTANVTLTLPIMLACAVAAAVSKHLSHGSVYTTKLLRRGIDIERPKPASVLQTMTVGQVMQPIPEAGRKVRLLDEPTDGGLSADGGTRWRQLGGEITDVRTPQELFEEETLEQALRQLALFGHAGLPVLSEDRQHLRGWITRQGILGTLANSVTQSERTAEQGAIAADFAVADPEREAHRPPDPLDGYRIVELTVDSGAAIQGARLEDVRWPAGAVLVGGSRGSRALDATAEITLEAGDRVVLLARAVPRPSYRHRLEDAMLPLHERVRERRARPHNGSSR